MNLRMDPVVVEELATGGLSGAVELGEFDHDHHMWVRYRLAMSEFDEALSGMKQAYDEAYEEFLGTYDPGASRFGPLGTPSHERCWGRRGEDLELGGWVWCDCGLAKSRRRLTGLDREPGSGSRS